MLRNGRFELRSRSLCSLWCELVSSNIIVVDVVSMVRYPFLVSESLVDPVSWCMGVCAEVAARACPSSGEWIWLIGGWKLFDVSYAA